MGGGMVYRYQHVELTETNGSECISFEIGRKNILDYQNGKL